MSRCVLFITAILLIECTAISELERKLVCPKGWTYLEAGNHCIMANNTVKYSFLDSLDECLGMSSDKYKVGLATVSNRQSNADLCKVLKREQGIQVVWVGGTDHQQEGNFKWQSNGQSVVYGFTNKDYTQLFDPGQPNDKKTGKPGDAQNCLVMSTQTCRWNDWKCHFEHPKACEIYEANRCERDNGECQHVCIITGPNSRRCLCRQGFELVDDFFCQDIDECMTTSKGVCHNSKCINFYGGWECLCNDNGYGRKISQFECEDVNPCNARNGGCQHLCRFEKGARKCDCVVGYYGINHTSENCARFIAEDIERNSNMYILMAIFTVILSTMISSVVLGYLHRTAQDHHTENEADQVEIESVPESGEVAWQTTNLPRKSYARPSYYYAFNTDSQVSPQYSTRGNRVSNWL